MVRHKLVAACLFISFVVLLSCQISGQVWCPGGSCSVPAYRQPIQPTQPIRQTTKPSVAPWTDKDVIEMEYPWSSKNDEYVSKNYSGPDGRMIRNDMDMNLFLRNTGGSDGAGLCVFTSIQHSVHYQGLGMYGFRKFMESRPGGGWPEKVDRTIKEFCSRNGLNIPSYSHVYGTNNMNLIEEAVNSGKMVCCTWGTDFNHYNGSTIAHMVNLVYLDKEWGAILDNNFHDEFLWVKRPTLDKYIAWTGLRSSDGSWFIIFNVNGIPIRGSSQQ